MLSNQFTQSRNLECCPRYMHRGWIVIRIIPTPELLRSDGLGLFIFCRDMRKRYVAIYKKKLDRVRHGQVRGLHPPRHWDP
jgi:hypothetical protein